ncbi:MAG: hypothetical protein EOO75_16230 [Myxococcales bacterium]|nr:MAG: hypothetical protein EOO75_16230 [Myxococcales bacterium]
MGTFCACDGKKYCSPCNAHKAGSDVSLLDCENGEAGAAGTGGAGGGSGGSGGSAGGGNVVFCGGLPGDSDDCAPDEFCHYASTLCGTDDQAGTCQKRPTECPPVDCSDDMGTLCACDGKKYCTECQANLVGIDLRKLGSCQ